MDGHAVTASPGARRGRVVAAIPDDVVIRVELVTRNDQIASPRLWGELQVVFVGGCDMCEAEHDQRGQQVHASWSSTAFTPDALEPDRHPRQQLPGRRVLPPVELGGRAGGLPPSSTGGRTQIGRAHV